LNRSENGAASRGGFIGDGESSQGGEDSPQKKARKALVEMHEYESKIQNRVKFMERE
jgi:hypothetical protein